MAASLGRSRKSLRSSMGAPMPNSKIQNAPEGVRVDLAGGLESTNQNTQEKSSTDSAILANKSTAIEVQLAKVLALLRQGPKTTIELRQNGIMMPAARVFTLKHEFKHNITTELLALFDAEGIRHSKCARYHLVVERTSEVTA
jgi:uncharacterized protein YbcC (UPF0753/DUF2309 family)